MALTYNKATRNLSIKGTITLGDGTRISVTDSEILNYSFSPQIGSEGLPLGATEATAFRLEIGNTGKLYTPEMFDGAKVHMQVGIMDAGEYVYSDFGVWYVDDCSAPEQSVSMNLSGYDALATHFGEYYKDNKDVYPSTIGSIVNAVCVAAGIRLKSASFPNAAITVKEMPEWGEDTTLRDILSYCAICAAGFARIALDGELEIVSFADGKVYNIGTDLYQTFTRTGGSAFVFNAIEAMLSDEDEEYSRFAVDETIEDNATNTIQIDYNPLITESIVNSIVTELNGIAMDPGTMTWGGDPSVVCGDYYEIQTLNGNTIKIMVTAQSFTFDGGLTVTESCNLPTLNTQSSASYSTGTNMYDSKGKIRATRISGLDKTVVNATVGHFNKLTAESAEFDKLLTAYLNAINLVVDRVDAKVLKAGSVTADKIAAKVIETASLEAITAKIGSLTASDITTDRLAAALAAFTVVTAGTASFDKATIQHLVANAMNLEFGVADQVFIQNLAVRYAQMVGATIGELCIKASDGSYYLLDVKADGTVSATKTTVSEGEINAGQTGGGKVILETSITAQQLNTGNLLATYALINRIDAARIDVDQLFAREAFISLLRTSKIVGDKSITMIAGEAEKSNRNFLQTEQPTGADLVRPGDTWTIPETGQVFQAEAVSDLGLKFYLDSDGSLYYELSDNDDAITLSMQDFDLYIDGAFFSVLEDGSFGTPYAWRNVQGQALIDIKDRLDNLYTALTLDNDGVHIHKEGNLKENEIFIDGDSVDVIVNGERYSSFIAGGVEFGNYRIWQPAESGGLAFNLIG